MNEQHDDIQNSQDSLVPSVEDSPAEVSTTSQQVAPWFDVCRSGAMPALSTLAAAALINLPDIIQLVYGGGGGGGGTPKGH